MSVEYYGRTLPNIDFISPQCSNEAWDFSIKDNNGKSIIPTVEQSKKGCSFFSGGRSDSR